MTLWALHITGSDGLIAMPSGEVARQHKASYDLMDGLAGPVHPELGQLDPTLGARVVEWPYSPEAHAKQLREAETRGSASTGGHRE